MLLKIYPTYCLMLGWQWFTTNSCSFLCYGVLGQCWDSSSGDVEGNCPADKGENWQHTAVSRGLYGWWGQTLSEGQHWWGKGQLDFCPHAYDIYLVLMIWYMWQAVKYQYLKSNINMSKLLNSTNYLWYFKKSLNLQPSSLRYGVWWCSFYQKLLDLPAWRGRNQCFTS